jgi:hypothetical protein
MRDLIFEIIDIDVRLVGATMPAIMQKRKKSEMTTEEILAYLEKPKSMRYICQLLKPIFREAHRKFGDAIVEIVEREHWGPNFDAYYDVWVRSRSSEVQDFFLDNLFKLQDDEFIFIFAQVKETDDYCEVAGEAPRKRSKSVSLV